MVAPTLLGGTPYVHRDRALPGDPFVGVRAAAPPGGSADIQCSLGSTPLYDGSDSHPEVPEWVLPRPGRWSCAAREVAGGLDDARDDVRFGTPFSPPIAFDVLSVFRYREGAGSPRHAAASARALRFLAEFPPEARGGVARVKPSGASRAAPAAATVTRKAGHATAPASAPKRAEVKLRRPKRGFYFARFAFGGTHFLRPLAKTDPIRLQVKRKRLRFVSALEFTPC